MTSTPDFFFISRKAATGKPLNPIYIIAFQASLKYNENRYHFF
jgi:hypothetical protein